VALPGSPDLHARTSAMVIALHSELYPLEAIAAGVAAFSAYGELVVATAGAYHRVSIRPKDPSAAVHLAQEFANYVLAAAATVESPGDGTP
jgi:hypothetical protein